MRAAVCGDSGGPRVIAVFGGMSGCQLNPSDNLNILYLVYSLCFILGGAEPYRCVNFR